MKIKTPDIKIFPGKGFLKKMTPYDMPYPNSPPFRGALQMPRGKMVFLNAWMHTNQYGTILYLHIATTKKRRKAMFDGIARERADRAELKRLILEKAEYEVGPAPKPKPQPKEIRRKDVI